MQHSYHYHIDHFSVRRTLLSDGQFPVTKVSVLERFDFRIVSKKRDSNLIEKAFKVKASRYEPEFQSVWPTLGSK